MGDAGDKTDNQRNRRTRPRRATLAYTVRFGVGTILYAVCIVAAGPWARSLGDSPWRFVVACLPMIGVGLCVWAMIRLSRDVDEMQSRKLLEALVLSAAGTVLSCLAYGLTESVGAPRLSAAWVVALWAIWFLVGQVYVAWRYR